MRERLIAPGVAAAAFAVTLTVALWQRRPPAPAPAPPVSASARLQIATPPFAPPALVDHGQSVSTAKEILSSTAAADEDAAPQPAVPDSARLPSYQEDQAARDGEALRSARSR